MLNSDVSKNETVNNPSSSISEDFINIQISSNPAKLFLNYKYHIQEIFKTFKDIKRILQITNFCIKNISTET